MKFGWFFGFVWGAITMAVVEFGFTYPVLWFFAGTSWGVWLAVAAHEIDKEL